MSRSLKPIFPLSRAQRCCFWRCVFCFRRCVKAARRAREGPREVGENLGNASRRGVARIGCRRRSCGCSAGPKILGRRHRAVMPQGLFIALKSSMARAKRGALWQNCLWRPPGAAPLPGQTRRQGAGPEAGGRARSACCFWRCEHPGRPKFMPRCCRRRGRPTQCRRPCDADSGSRRHGRSCARPIPNAGGVSGYAYDSAPARRGGHVHVQHAGAARAARRPHARAPADGPSAPAGTAVGSGGPRASDKSLRLAPGVSPLRVAAAAAAALVFGEADQHHLNGMLR